MRISQGYLPKEPVINRPKERAERFNSGYKRKKRRIHCPKRAKSYKVFILPFLIMLFIAGLIPGVRYLSKVWDKWEYLEIRQINIEGNNRISMEQIKDWCGIRKGMNILSLDIDSIADIAEEQPWIRYLEVERRFPGSVSIKVEESTPVAVWEDDGKSFFLDEFGILLEEIDDKEIPFLGLPVLTGFKQGNSMKGGKCPSPYWPIGLSIMEDIKDVFPELMGEIDNFCIFSEKQLVILLKEGRKIFLSPGDISIKLRLLRALKERMPDHWQAMKYCDLRFEFKIILMLA